MAEVPPSVFSHPSVLYLCCGVVLVLLYLCVVLHGLNATDLSFGSFVVNVVNSSLFGCGQ